MAENPNGSNGFSLEHDSWGRLVLTDAAGVRHSPVEPVCAFPLSDPDRWISICDVEGRELVAIDDVATLASEVRSVLEADLARREFVPQLRRVLAAPSDNEPSEWEVETDRGTTRFLVNSSDDIRRLGPHRILIIDTQGIRYAVDDSRLLDPVSRRIIERYL